MCGPAHIWFQIFPGPTGVSDGRVGGRRGVSDLGFSLSPAGVLPPSIRPLSTQAAVFRFTAIRLGLSGQPACGCMRLGHRDSVNQPRRETEDRGVGFAVFSSNPAAQPAGKSGGI